MQRKRSIVFMLTNEQQKENSQYSEGSFFVVGDILNEFLCGDSLALMRKMPDACVDLVVTSPPYNLKNSTGNGMKDGRGGNILNFQNKD